MSASGWSCVHCTFVNVVTDKVCSVCQRARGVEGSEEDHSLKAGGVLRTAVGESSEEDQLQRALRESAALHSSTITSEQVLASFSALRSKVRVTPSLPALQPADSTLLQVGALNQFHRHWAPLIERYRTPSAICGYTALGYASLLAGMPEAELPTDIASLQALFCSHALVDPLVERAMAQVRDWRQRWIAAHPADFAPVAQGADASPGAYTSAWVANYEVSDYIRALPVEVGRHILFVRFNQYPEREVARHEEQQRLEEERPFGGRAGGGKSDPDSYAAGDSMFILEAHCGAEGGWQLLRPEHPRLAALSWRAAIVDLDGHFAVAVVLGGQLYLVNTTQANYLNGSGLLATAMAHDALLKRGIVGTGAGAAAATSAAGGAASTGSQ